MSKYLSPKLIIAEAWELTREHKKQLFWYGFIPAFLGMIVGTVYVIYQIVAFRHAVLQERDTIEYGELFQVAWNFLTAEGTPTGTLIILAIIVCLGYITVPVFCKSSLIFLIKKIKTGEDLEKGIQVGFLRFMPMFEYGALKNFASPFSFFTESSFVFRSLGPGMFRLLLPVFIILAFFGLIALFFFAYVEQIIVLKKKGVMASIADSSKLAFNYFSETLRLFLLILLIELRVFFNIAIILLLPFTVFGIMSFFTAMSITKGIGVAVAGIVVFAMISVASAIYGTLEIFSTAIWTLAFDKFATHETEDTEL